MRGIAAAGGTELLIGAKVASDGAAAECSMSGCRAQRRLGLPGWIADTWLFSKITKLRTILFFQPRDLLISYLRPACNFSKADRSWSRSLKFESHSSCRNLPPAFRSRSPTNLTSAHSR